MTKLELIAEILREVRGDLFKFVLGTATPVGAWIWTGGLEQLLRIAALCGGITVSLLTSISLIISIRRKLRKMRTVAKDDESTT